MSRQLDQLPSDPTSLARKVHRLEREMRELRAARRMTAATAGLIQTAVSGARIVLTADGPALVMYGEDGTILARMSPDIIDGGAGLWTRGVQEPLPLAAYLYGGELRFRPVEDDQVIEDATVVYSSDANTYADLILSSGRVFSGDVPAQVILETDAGGGPPSAFVHAMLVADNWAFGQAAIVPSAANTPTSLAVTGLNLKGNTFYAQATPATTVPGTVVTGCAATGASATGVNLWVTRTNTTSTQVYWMVIGK